MTAFESLTRNEADMAFRRRAHLILEWLGAPVPGQRILDLGCGRGFYLKMLRHLGFTAIYGIDRELELLPRARRRLRPGPAPVGAASAGALPFPDSRFDAVILSEVLEHLGDEAAALAEIRRVLKPGGRLLITVPHARYPFLWDPLNWLLEHAFGNHIASGPLAGIWAHHRRLYTPESLRAAVGGAGLEIADERSFLHHCLPFTHNLLYGVGKPLLESRLLRPALGAVDRAAFDAPAPARWNPLRWALALLRFADRRNAANEPPGRTTVNLALLAVKPS